MNNETEESIDANFDAQVQASSKDENPYIENNLHLISDIMKPDLRNFTSNTIKEKDKGEELLKEFQDVTKEWASGNISKEEKAIVDEYNELIGLNSRKGYWRGFRIDYHSR